MVRGHSGRNTDRADMTGSVSEVNWVGLLG